MSALTLAPAPDSFGLGGRSAEDRFQAYKEDLHRQLITNMDMGTLDRLSDEELRQAVRRTAEQLCHLRPELLGLRDRERLVSEVLDETFGLGPLEPLMRDPTVTDILINGPKAVYVERQRPAGAVAASSSTTTATCCTSCSASSARVGRRVDETSPMVDARLPDGSRINAIIPPLALDGTLVSIRRFGTRPLLMADLVAQQGR